MAIGRGDGILLCRNEFKLPEYRISPALFALFLSHVATATLLRYKTKITQRYAIPALTYIGERGLRVIGPTSPARHQERHRCLKCGGRL